MNRGSYEDLKIWQKSMSFVQVIYVTTRSFPKDKRYDLTSQMRRAAVSIPSNIAEGSQRVSRKDFAHFILIAKGSLAELRTQIRIAGNLGYCTDNQTSHLLTNAEEINKMMYAFYNSLKAES
jgi:four helix bundle protein